MRRLLTWPSELPGALDGLFTRVADASGAAEVVRLDHLSDAASGAADEVLLAVPEAAVAGGASPGEVLDGLRALGATDGPGVLLVVGDGYLGTDVRDLAAASVGAAAVAAVRSLAVRRRGSRRANVVCVPEGLLGEAGDLRGPLRQPVELVDVVEAAAFLLGDGGRYLSGQVLFVDGGRHLFSSMTA